MINRLVLNLIHGANARDDSEFRTRTGLEPPTFATGPYLGNIGGPVRTLSDDFEDEFLDGDGGVSPGELENEPSGSPGIGDGDGVEHNAEAGPSTSRAAVGIQEA